MIKQAKVLIIDDDIDLVEIMKLTLMSKNYKVTSAYDGNEGLKKAKEIEPDLIILDVMMKTELEGFNVSYDLRQDPGLQYVPILMVTAITKKTGFSFSLSNSYPRKQSFQPVQDTSKILPDVFSGNLQVSGWELQKARISCPEPDVHIIN